MTFAFEWSRPLLEWRPLLFGGVLIFFLVFLPGGLESLWGKIRDRLASLGGGNGSGSTATARE